MCRPPSISRSAQGERNRVRHNERPARNLRPRVVAAGPCEPWFLDSLALPSMGRIHTSVTCGLLDRVRAP